MVDNGRLAHFHQPKQLSLDFLRFTWKPSSSSGGLDPTAAA